MINEIFKGREAIISPRWQRRLRAWTAVLFASAVMLALLFILTLPVSAQEDEGETMPHEYGELIGSLDESVIDKLPAGALSDKTDEVNEAAGQLCQPYNILSLLIDAFGVGVQNAAPTLAAVLGIIILSAALSALSQSIGGASAAVENCIRLCTFSAISGMAVASVKSLSLYFERLFSAVAAFVPLSSALYAMGGNLTLAASSSAGLGVTLTVCQFFCTKTVIPVFCICLCLSMLSIFDGAAAGGAVGGALRKWYTTSLAFVMMILTCSVAGSGLLASRADNMAMRSAKFAVSSFIPVSGGTVSSTLGTLVSSSELLRGSVGVIGIGVIILLLVPTIIELALLRAVFAIGGFCAQTLGLSKEASLLTELDSLYGYLEGIAALSSAIFIIAFGVFATTQSALA